MNQSWSIRCYPQQIRHDSQQAYGLDRRLHEAPTLAAEDIYKLRIIGP